MQVSQQQIRSKFKELDTNNTGILEIQQISSIFHHFDCDMPHGRLYKLIEKIYFYNKMNTMTRFENNIQENKVQQKIKQRMQTQNQVSSQGQNNQENMPANQQQDQQQEQEQQQYQKQVGMFEIPPLQNYNLNIDEFLKAFYLANNKIDYEFFKLTCSLLELQYYALKSTNKNSFPLKDPAPEAKINLTIGQQLSQYNSRFYVKLLKIPAETNTKQQQISIKISVRYPFSQTINIIAQKWKEMFELIQENFYNQIPRGKQFLQSIKITTENNQTEFTLKITSNNSYLNEWIYTLSKVGDIALKTQLRAKLQFLLSFNFDLAEFIKNPDCTIDDFLMKNIKIQFKGQISEIMSSLKQLAIAQNLLSGLSSVHDDDESLIYIALLNIHSLNLNLKFKNQIFQHREQETLYAFLTLLKQASQQFTQSLAEISVLEQLIKNLLKCSLHVQLKAHDFKLNADLQIKNLDKLLFDTSEVMKKFMDNDD